MIAREPVHARQRRIRRAMDIDGVYFQAQLMPRYGQRLYFVEEHNGRAVHRQFRDGLLEQFGDRLLAPAVRRAHERMRVNFREGRLRPGKLLGDLVGKATRERRFFLFPARR